MKKIFVVFFLFFIFMAQAQHSSEAVSVTGAASFYLDENELKSCIEKAEQGDGNASMKVYRHFSLGLYDAEKSKYWLKYAADLNVPEAQYELAYHYLMSGEVRDAEKWAEKARFNGSPDAVKIIDEIKRKKLRAKNK
ncbi:hypothetical protein [Paracidovorax avenae]|uniref:hypothetical protein n=1 Tax=Paracidovorax avenae TaxID=80867 RepID=UPI001313ED38|nr:hypothetical protein [Paracidovorax avenae]